MADFLYGLDILANNGYAGKPLISVTEERRFIYKTIEDKLTHVLDFLGSNYELIES